MLLSLEVLSGSLEGLFSSELLVHLFPSRLVGVIALCCHGILNPFYTHFQPFPSY